MSLIRKFATVASGTLVSRVLGFTREMLMAAALGTGPVADAFYAAFQFPNTFRRLFAEGAFNAAFVPLFSKEIEANGVDGAKKFSEEVFGVLFSALLVLTILMELSMPLIVRYLVAPGFSDEPGKFGLTVGLATIMFPYLICMSLAAMMSGMLNSLRRYFAAAIAPVFLNIILIGVLAYAWRYGHDGMRVGYALSWGVLAAGLVQLAIVWVAVRHAGISIGFRRPRLTSNVKRLLWLAFPAAITGGITQINTLVGTAIASGQSGAVSSLSLADRVYQLPLGVVGIAVAIVLLPELARALKAGNLVEAANLQNRSVEFTLFLTLPAAAALLAMSEPIVRVLYERGQFAADGSTPVVAAILAIFALGLPAFVLIKAFTPGYFAREDTRTPMYFAGLSVLVNISIALSAVSDTRRAGHSRRLRGRGLDERGAAPRRADPAWALGRRPGAHAAHTAAGARRRDHGRHALWRHALVRAAARLRLAGLCPGSDARGNRARRHAGLFRRRLRAWRRRHRHDPQEHQAGWRETCCTRSGMNCSGQNIS